MTPAHVARIFATLAAAPTPKDPARAFAYWFSAQPLHVQKRFVDDWLARSAAAPTPAIDRPEIVCLCGSTRFYDEFQAANYDLTMLGKIVLSVGFYPHAKALHGHGEGVGHDSAEKVALDELHKRKIDLADRVYVINIGGYIGESTRSEIDYALAHGKPVDYWDAALDAAGTEEAGS